MIGCHAFLPVCIHICLQRLNVKVKLPQKWFWNRVQLGETLGLAIFNTPHYVQYLILSDFLQIVNAVVIKCSTERALKLGLT